MVNVPQTAGPRSSLSPCDLSNLARPLSEWPFFLPSASSPSPKSFASYVRPVTSPVPVVSLSSRPVDRESFMFDPSTSPELPALPGLSRMSPQAKTLLQLPSNACRWPVGESWCGRPAVHGPYCHGHHLRSRDARSLMRIVEAARSGGTTGTVQHYLEASHLGIPQAGETMRRFLRLI